MKQELTCIVAIITVFVIGAFFGTKLEERKTRVNKYPSPEYQFVVTDDSIAVQDFGRKVGTVKIEGQLEELITKDNE